MQVGWMGYRVFVLEVSECGETFYYVCNRRGNDLGDGIPSNLHEEVESCELSPQIGLCPDRVFSRRASAKKAVRKICNKLRHQGFVVNPWEPVYSLYVIELKRKEGDRSRKPLVYVGETSIKVEQRYAQHLAGGRLASSKVTGRAIRLRPDLVPPANLSNRKASVAAETHLGKKLMEEGYEVLGPQGLKD